MSALDEPAPIQATVGDAKGTLLSFAGQTVELQLDTAFAPGRPLIVRAGDLRLDVKSLGSKKTEGGYRLRAQLRTLTKADRRRLEKLFGEAG